MQRNGHKTREAVEEALKPEFIVHLASTLFFYAVIGLIFKSPN